MNAKQQRTLELVFAHPTPATVRWGDVERLIEAVGGTVDRQHEGSRVRFRVYGVTAVFHEPHPGSETPKATLRDVREFLDARGIRP